MLPFSVGGMLAFVFEGAYKLSDAGSVMILGSNITVEFDTNTQVKTAVIESTAVNSQIIVKSGTEIEDLTVKEGAVNSERSAFLKKKRHSILKIYL